MYNNKITRRFNNFIRRIIVNPNNRKRLLKEDFTLLCNNCNGGIILHDLGLRFNTPTINMFFHSTDFFDLTENLNDYLCCELKEELNPNYIPEFYYPVGSLGERKKLELHFMHYKSFEEAKNKWDGRKSRINFNDLYVMWTFFGETDETLFERFEKLPIKNKVAFVNREVDNKKFKSLFYIKGFEKEDGLGVLSLYQGLNGKRYYDQFDYVKWFNSGKW